MFVANYGLMGANFREKPTLTIHDMDSIVSFLEEIYDSENVDIVEKYYYLFHFLVNSKPITTPLFTYYPRAKVVETQCGVLHLTQIHSRIFHTIAKNMGKMPFVPREYIRAVVYRGKRHVPPLGVMSVHVGNLNRELEAIGLVIKNARGKGSWIERIPGKRKKTAWKPFELRADYIDPFDVRPW